MLLFTFIYVIFKLERKCIVVNKYKFLNDKFLKNNLKIFPLYENGKIPLVAHWKEDASCDKAQVVYWLENAKNCNWALPSTLNNLFVIDIDMHNDVDGLQSFVKLCNDLNLVYENIDDLNTLYQTTPSNGIHLIFKSDEELNKVKNKANFFNGYPGIDVRTDGYIAVEPSAINGIGYKFYGEIEDIEEMPSVLRDYILKCNSENVSDEKVIDSLYDLNKVVLKGSRDDTIFNYISSLYNNTKLNFNEILALALAYNRDCFDPPLKDRDIEYKVRRMFKSERSKIFIIRISDEEGGENEL